MNDDFTGLNDSWHERQKREHIFRQQRRAVIAGEVGLFLLITFGVAVGGVVGGLIAGDEAKAAVIRFGFAAIGCAVGGGYGLFRATVRVFREAITAEITGAAEEDPASTFRWTAWTVGIVIGSGAAVIVVKTPTPGLVGAVAVGTGIVVAVGIWLVELYRGKK